MCYDPVHGYVILFGGYNDTGVRFNDTWTWDGTTWTQMPNAPVNVIAGCGMAFHPPSNEVLLVGEQGQGYSSLASYAWDGQQWNSRGTLPGLSTNNNNYVSKVLMTFDPVRGQMLAYGHDQYFLPKMAFWDGLSWTSTFLPTVPSAAASNNISAASMAWDPSVSRSVLTYTDGSICRFYEWSGMNWQQRLPAPLPARSGPSALDTWHNRVVMVDSDYASITPNHTWTIANGVFTRLNTPFEPTLRSSSAMAFDSARGVCVLFGGNNGYLSMADTWEFDLGATATYTTFGNGCLGSRGTPHIAPQGNSLPRVGSTFTLQATNLPWTGPVFLFLGLSDTNYHGTPLPADLGFLGAPNCAALCSSDELHVLTNVLGSGAWSFTVPPFPGVTFFNQVLPLDPGANPLGLTVSNGGRGVIGL